MNGYELRGYVLNHIYVLIKLLENNSNSESRKHTK